jgi:hypothetical protein
MRRIADYGIEWYEEPLPPLDFEGYAALRARAPMPIATGEALYTAWDFKRLLNLCAVDIVQPDLSMCGGLRAGREIALLARLHHVRLSPHVWGGGVGLAAACHFVASLPDYPHSRNIVQPPLIEYDVGDNALRDTIFKEPMPIVVENGACVLPNRPGLGVELDHNRRSPFQRAVGATKRHVPCATRTSTCRQRRSASGRRSTKSAGCGLCDKVGQRATSACRVRLTPAACRRQVVPAMLKWRIGQKSPYWPGRGRRS